MLKLLVHYVPVLPPYRNQPVDLHSRKTLVVNGFRLQKSFNLSAISLVAHTGTSMLWSTDYFKVLPVVVN